MLRDFVRASLADPKDKAALSAALLQPKNPGQGSLLALLQLRI